MERLLARFRPSAPGPRNAALRLDASDATVAPDLNETLSAEQLIVDREPRERCSAGFRLGFLAHRRPHVGVHHIGARGGLVGIVA